MLKHTPPRPISNKVETGTATSASRDLNAAGGDPGTQVLALTDVEDVKAVATVQYTFHPFARHADTASDRQELELQKM